MPLRPRTRPRASLDDDADDDFPDDKPGAQDGRVVDTAEAEAQVRAWLTKNTQSLEAESSMRFKIEHCSRGGYSRVGGEFEYAFEGPEVIRRISKEMVDAAVDHALTMQGRMQYKIIPDSGVKPCTFHLMVPLPDEDPDAWGADNYQEPATRMGLMGQMMRHTEKFADKMLHSTDVNVQSLERQVRNLTVELKETKGREIEAVKLYTSLASMGFAQKIATAEFERTQQRKDEAVKGLLKVAPALAIGLLGPKAGAILGGMGGPPPPGMAGPAPGFPPGHGPPPQGSPAGPPVGFTPDEHGQYGSPQGPPAQDLPFGFRTPLELLVEDLFTSLSSDQVQTIVATQVLSPTQVMGIMRIHEFITERAERETEAKEARANAHKKPHAEPGETGRPAVEMWTVTPVTGKPEGYGEDFGSDGAFEES